MQPDRVDQAPEESFVSDLKVLLADIEEIKTRQFVGPSSLISNYTESNNQFDINGTSFSAFQERVYRITFTPDPDQNDKPYAELVYNYSVTNADGFETVQWFPDPNNATDDQTRAWVFIFTNSFNVTNLYAKFGVKSAQTGSLSLEVVS